MQSIATFTKKDKSNACFKNITYVEMVTTEKSINVCYKTALECEESIE